MPEAASARPGQKKSGAQGLAKTLMAHYARSRDVAVAFFVIATLAIIVYPLSPGMMDFLLAINITLSLILLLTTIYVSKPIDMSVFPSLLLVLTLFRLSLNVASTRLILSRAPVDGQDAAGGIIRTFGEFVGGNNLAIGVTIFAILVIIQFVVITKGATRIAEVAARFTLDAMPGQQMAIDADLNAGLIDEATARQRREDLRRLTDFYGAMDGASKFVRGDAIAGIIITFVNIIAGLAIGTLMSEPAMDLATAGKVFTTLTIGDGLSGQMPALLISIASGLLVTRSASKVNFGEEVLQQLFAQRRSVGLASIMLTGLGLISMVGITPFPAFPLIVLGVACGANWYNMMRGTVAEEIKAKEKAAAKKREDTKQPAHTKESAEEFLKIDPMELEVGYALVPLVDVSHGSGGGLLSRVQMIRNQMAQELGIIVPPIRIRDNIQLDFNAYAIKIQGMTVASGVAEPDRLLAMDSGMVTEKIDGIKTTEPAFGLPAVWIQQNNREHAERVGYTVVDAETVVATHLSEVIKSHSHELLTREEVRRLIDKLKETSPNLVQEVIPNPLSIADVQKVLQGLLRERVSIRNLPTILEVLGDVGRRTKDSEILIEYVRNALSRWLCNTFAEEKKLYVVTIDPKLEDIIQKSIQQTDSGAFLAMRPQVTQKIVAKISDQVARQLQNGHSALVMTGPQIRSHVKRMTESQLPLLSVISYNEVTPEYEVESIGMVSVEL